MSVDEKELEINFGIVRPSISKMLGALRFQPIAGLALQSHCCRSLSLPVLLERYKHLGVEGDSTCCGLA